MNHAWDWSRAGVRRPIRIWRYYGWCAICRPCNQALTYGRRTQLEALEAACSHLRTSAHLIRMEGKR